MRSLNKKSRDPRGLDKKKPDLDPVLSLIEKT